jgi:hypothetical protein
MTCRQKLSPVKSYKVGGVTYPRPSGAIAGTRHISDTHLELAELLQANLDEWLKGVHPMTSPGLRKIYAEEITDQAFDALHDLAMDIDATPEEW